MSSLAMPATTAVFAIGLVLIGVWIVIDDNPKYLILAAGFVLLATVFGAALVYLRLKRGDS